MATPGDLSNIVDVPMDKIKLVSTDIMTDQDDWYVATGLDEAAVERMRQFQRETQPIISPEDVVVYHHPNHVIAFQKAFGMIDRRKKRLLNSIYKRKPDLAKQIDVIRRNGGDFEEQFLEVRRTLR